MNERLFRVTIQISLKAPRRYFLTAPFTTTYTWHEAACFDDEE